MSKLIDLTGKTFGRLKVIKRKLDDSYINGEALWECICLCPKNSVVYACGSQLRQGQKKSCGCIWKPQKEELYKNIKYRLEKYSKLNGQCIEWTGFKDKDGYGEICITINGKEKPYKAHRASWMIHVGDIPNDMFICHRCDNPACFRIEHLFLGTHTDNMRDKCRKGRNNHYFGSTSPFAKINEQIAKEILDMKGKGISSHELSKKFGIAASSIRAIWQRRNWKHI